jgi:hypothetical protein
MTNGLDIGEGEAVGLAVVVGVSVTRADLPGRAQEASRINGKRRKTNF